MQLSGIKYQILLNIWNNKDIALVHHTNCATAFPVHVSLGVFTTNESSKKSKSTVHYTESSNKTESKTEM
jgi:hypothetical protein